MRISLHATLTLDDPVSGSLRKPEVATREMLTVPHAAEFEVSPAYDGDVMSPPRPADDVFAHPCPEDTFSVPVNEEAVLEEADEVFAQSERLSDQTRADINPRLELMSKVFQLEGGMLAERTPKPDQIALAFRRVRDPEHASAHGTVIYPVRACFCQNCSPFFDPLIKGAGHGDQAPKRKRRRNRGRNRRPLPPMSDGGS